MSSKSDHPVVPSPGAGQEDDVRGLSRRTLLERGTVIAGSALAVGAFRPSRLRASVASSPAAGDDADVPTAWFDLALELVRTTPGFSAPVASRAFAYAGVALYEAVAPGVPCRPSLAGQLNGLAPSPAALHRPYHWPTVANAALAAILRRLFPTAAPEGVAAIDELERRFSMRAQAEIRPGVYRRSRTHGRRVAAHIFQWSKSDGGHEAFLTNFPAYTPPTGPGLWVPTPPDFLPALQPYWGANRPFVLPTGAACSPGAPPRYSEEPASEFYTDAYECYQTTSHLTAEQEAIARFWADDPEETASPPGHSLSILTQVARRFDLNLAQAAEAYAKLGVAVADAFIACWRTKYRYNVLRPVTYVRDIIDARWAPLLVTPPFPEYTSGHSTQSAAAARVLTDLFGNVAFVDRTHIRRGLPARSFDSFREAAEEAAISRLYAGIHFRAAIDRGLRQGHCVGRRVSALHTG